MYEQQTGCAVHIHVQYTKQDKLYYQKTGWTILTKNRIGCTTRKQDGLYYQKTGLAVLPENRIGCTFMCSKRSGLYGQQTRGEAVQTKISKNRIACANRKQDGLYTVQCTSMYSKRIGTVSINRISCVQTTKKTGCTDQKTGQAVRTANWMGCTYMCRLCRQQR
jgi:hypothetical protein